MNTAMQELKAEITEGYTFLADYTLDEYFEHGINRHSVLVIIQDDHMDGFPHAIYPIQVDDHIEYLDDFGNSVIVQSWWTVEVYYETDQDAYLLDDAEYQRLEVA